MKRHPTDGTLRRLLDEPVAVSDADRAHVAGCPICLAELAQARSDAAVAAVAMTPSTAGIPDVDEGWRRLSAGLTTERARPAAPPAVVRPRWSARLRTPVVAIAGVVLLMTGAGIAAAADWLPIFRTEQIAPVTITADDLVALPDLSAYGDVTVVDEPGVHPVADSAAAAAATGLTVPQVAELPGGVSGDPEILAGGQAVVQFTFSAATAAQAVAPAALPAPPLGLDGSRFRLVAGPGVLQMWAADSGLPALAVGRAVAPTAYSSGIDFVTARDYVLSLPGLPADLVAQLGAFTGDGTTLPLPLPADLASSAPAEVNGTPAQLLTSRDGAVTAVVWVQDGVVTAVGGSLSADEVLTVARELR
ncbi:hypothetical protein [Nakamurella sp.]|uniref:hypothetical protein n=1 Tax=Nakamurella sp. TaxID=1869182 RepID=UPI003783B72D